MIRARGIQSWMSASARCRSTSTAVHVPGASRKASASSGSAPARCRSVRGVSAASGALRPGRMCVSYQFPIGPVAAPTATYNETMIGTSVAVCGYQFLRGADMRAALETSGSLADWDAFAASWNDLPLDPYLAQGARFRRRRFAVYAADASGAVVEREPHQPHFQHKTYNALFGGIERWFEP